jgi:hypothetical protein
VEIPSTLYVHTKVDKPGTFEIRLTYLHS